MRALPFMRAHRGILVLRVAGILERGAAVYAKAGEGRELRPKRTFGRGCERIPWDGMDFSRRNDRERSVCV